MGALPYIFLFTNQSCRVLVLILNLSIGVRRRKVNLSHMITRFFCASIFINPSCALPILLGRPGLQVCYLSIPYLAISCLSNGGGRYVGEGVGVRGGAAGRGAD